MTLGTHFRHCLMVPGSSSGSKLNQGSQQPSGRDSPAKAQIRTTLLEEVREGLRDELSPLGDEYFASQRGQGARKRNSVLKGCGITRNWKNEKFSERLERKWLGNRGK